VALSRSTFENYAEWVRVEISKQPCRNGETTVCVPAEEPLCVSSTTQPKCCKQEFLKQLDRIRDHDEPMESVGSY
jgi:hypothetical protein